MAAQAAQQSEPVRQSLLSRLHAWWEGYDASSDQAGNSGAGFPTDTAEHEPDEAEALAWSPMRVDAAQRVFGSGQILAYSRGFLSELIRPLGLNETNNVLDYHCRIGTVTRRIAHDTGAWVDGLEEEPLLAESAQVFSAKEGIAKKAIVHCETLADFAKKRQSRDAVTAFETLYLDPEKEETLKTLSSLMKPGGQLLLTEYCWKSEAQKEADTGPWMRSDDEPLQLFTAQELRGLLETLKFEVHIVEDMSERYCEEILHALQSLAELLRGDPLPTAAKAWVLREVEHWASRAAVMRTGSIGLFRVHARSNGQSEIS